MVSSPVVTRQCWVNTQGHKSTLNSELSNFYVEDIPADVGLNFDPIDFRPLRFWLKWLWSGFNGFTCWSATPPPETEGHSITTPPTDTIWSPVWLGVIKFHLDFFNRGHNIVILLQIFYPWHCDSRRCQNSNAWSKSTAKEGHNSIKNPLNIDPGSVSQSELRRRIDRENLINQTEK